MARCPHQWTWSICANFFNFKIRQSGRIEPPSRPSLGHGPYVWHPCLKPLCYSNGKHTTFSIGLMSVVGFLVTLVISTLVWQLDWFRTEESLLVFRKPEPVSLILLVSQSIHLSISSHSNVFLTRTERFFLNSVTFRVTSWGRQPATFNLVFINMWLET